MNMIETASALATEIRSSHARIDSERSLPSDLASALAKAGLFRTLLPRSLGGLELDPAQALGSMEAIGYADASAGWCVMIGATSGMSAAYLDHAVAGSIHSSIDTVTGGVFAPVGHAVIDGDDFIVTGTWPWMSGHRHCEWLAGGCVIIEGGQPKRLENGMPDSRMVFFRAREARLLDGWHVSGLSGTGSGEVSVEQLRVPRTHSVSLITDAPRESGPLYRMPVFGLLAQGIAAVMLGNARGAIDDLIELAAHKHPQGSRRSLADRATVQAEVAKAQAALGSAKAYCRESIDLAWQRAVAGEPPDTSLRAQLRLSATWATRTAAEVTRSMYDLGGGSSVFLSCPLQRRFRDAHVGTQHAMVSASTYELTGRVLLGAPTDASLL